MSDLVKNLRDAARTIGGLYGPAADEIEQLQAQLAQVAEQFEQARTLYRETLDRAVRAEIRLDSIRTAVQKLGEDWRYAADDWAITGNEDKFVAAVEAVFQAAAAVENQAPTAPPGKPEPCHGCTCGGGYTEHCPHVKARDSERQRPTCEHGVELWARCEACEPDLVSQRTVEARAQEIRGDAERHRMSRLKD